MAAGQTPPGGLTPQQPLGAQELAKRVAEITAVVQQQQQPQQGFMGSLGEGLKNMAGPAFAAGLQFLGPYNVHAGKGQLTQRAIGTFLEQSAAGQKASSEKKAAAAKRREKIVEDVLKRAGEEARSKRTQAGLNERQRKKLEAEAAKPTAGTEIALQTFIATNGTRRLRGIDPDMTVEEAKTTWELMQRAKVERAAAQGSALAQAEENVRLNKPVGGMYSELTGVPANMTVGEVETQRLTYLPDKVQRELAGEKTGAETAIRSVNNILDLIYASPESIGLTGALTTFTGNLKAQAINIGSIMGFPVDRRILDINNPRYKDTWEGIGITSQRIKAQFIGLAYLGAMASGERGRGISDFDINNQLLKVGAAAKNKNAAVAILGDYMRDLDFGFVTKIKNLTGAERGSLIHTPKITAAIKQASAKNAAGEFNYTSEYIKYLTDRDVPLWRARAEAKRGLGS